MLKSKFIRKLLHGLIVLVGAGLGIAATLGGLQIYRWLRPSDPLEFFDLAVVYTLTACLGALLFHVLSGRIIHLCADVAAAIERYMNRLSSAQLISSSLGLIGGMLVAALLCQILTFMGHSMFTTAASAILYVILGLTGFSIGRHRSADMSSLIDKTLSFASKRKARSAAEEASPLRPKVLDASSLIDGRIVDVCRLGFVEGELVVPCFVVDELRRVADSTDALRRARGRRGLDMIKKLQDDGHITLRLDSTDYPEFSETDMKFLRLARELDAAIITGDVSLCKVARMSAMTALNLNELSAALRPAVIAGESLSVQLVKDGKEPDQGVGYLPDGTMVVTEGGHALIGRTAEVIVTSVLQTSAGRMIFARLKDEAAN